MACFKLFLYQNLLDYFPTECRRNYCTSLILYFIKSQIGCALALANFSFCLNSASLNQIDHIVTCHQMSSFNLIWWHFMTHDDIWWHFMTYGDFSWQSYVVCHDMSWQIMKGLHLIQRGGPTVQFFIFIDLDEHGWSRILKDMQQFLKQTVTIRGRSQLW